MILSIALLLFFLSYWQVGATTVVAARCSNGIVLAADSQSSDRVLISSRAAKKVFQLSKSTILCAAGNLPRGDTDFQQLYSTLRDIISSHESFFDSTLSTSAIAKVARQLINKQFNDAHIVVAGWDEQQGDECKYVLCEILPGGSKIEAPLVVAGTGSALIASLLEDSLQPYADQITASMEEKQPSMTISDIDRRMLTTEQTLPILKRSLTLASKLDPQTGGDKFSLWVLSKSTGSADKSSGGAVSSSLESV